MQRNKKFLMCIAGLGGAIGSTVSVGLSIADSDDSVNLGMVTESPIIKKMNLDLPLLKSIRVIGWDIKRDSLYQSAKEQKICPAEAIKKAGNKLKNLIPRNAYREESGSIEEWIKDEARYIRQECDKNEIEQTTMINLCPTEPYSTQVDDQDVDWEDLSTIKMGKSGITLSRLYFRLAIEAGIHFINYTPNIAETEKLQKLAKEKGIIYCGRDGKTGQTFIKTVIAPAFRDKNFNIDGWFSTNILGNNDGATLSNEDCRLTKRKSKSECLKSILGYTPGGEDSEYGHQVHIHYYPPRGDAKEAWDNIDFTGFLGHKMQMKINWLGQDSILAAPSILDLIRILSWAAHNGDKGLLSEVSYFFKSPLAPNGKTAQHAAPDQFNQLINYLKNSPRAESIN